MAEKTVSDVMPEGEGLDLPDQQVKLVEIEDEQVYILDCTEILTGKHGEYCAVTINREVQGECFFFCSQGVLMPKMQKLREEGHLPIFGTFFKKQGKDKTKNPYWDVK